MNNDFKNISLENLAGLLSSELNKENIEIILVGGACVTIYSNNKYQSYDLDFITYEDPNKVRKALEKLGFHENAGYFQRKDCKWIVEFVSPPVAVGNAFIHEFSEVKTDLGTIKMLKAIDCVKDRLSGFYHWADHQSLRQAVSICIEVTDVDLNELRRWSENENSIENFKYFIDCLNKQKGVHNLGVKDS